MTADPSGQPDRELLATETAGDVAASESRLDGARAILEDHTSYCAASRGPRTSARSGRRNGIATGVKPNRSA